MAVEIYLGNPPANIKQWIIDHASPASHSETRFTLEGGTVETYSITGTLDNEWMINNGFLDELEHTWSKTITQADIGNTVTNIGGLAFSGCSSLTSVMIPDDMTYIGSGAFSFCSSLTSLMIPIAATEIGEDTFYSCSGLKTVMIPDSVTTIGDHAFSGCSSLTSVTIVANGGNAANVKQAMIDAGCPSNITWNMP